MVVLLAKFGSRSEAYPLGGAADPAPGTDGVDPMACSWLFLDVLPLSARRRRFCRPSSLLVE
jgi:hypothetical protein